MFTCLLSASLKSGPAVCRLDTDEPVRNSKWQIVGRSEVWLSKNISRTFHTRRGALCWRGQRRGSER